MNPGQAAQVVSDADTLTFVACLGVVLIVMLLAAICARVLMR